MVIQQRKKVVVFCPGDVVTGGPELLHQLVDTLVKLGRDATICYYPFDQEFECPPPYLKYKAPQSRASEASEAILILPEIATKLARQFKSSDIMIWWLSVDNYFGTSRKSFARDFFQRFRSRYRGRLPLTKMKRFHHLTQSAYAQDFLEHQGIQSQMLTDYLSDEHMQLRETHPREDVILFNPKKGMRYTQLLKSAFPNFEFVPLENMTPAEISDHCRRAKVYIDFGHHPGKDRMPREAVIAGCCLITGRQGSAKFEEDILIPKSYKIDEASPNFVRNFGDVINSIFESIEDRTGDFDEYRARIRKEKSVFLHQVSSIFQGL